MAIAYRATTLTTYNAQENIRVKQMTSTRFMTLYTDPDTSFDTYLRMFDVSNNTITLIGSETVCLDYAPAGEESSWIDMDFEDGSSGVVVWCQTGSDDVYAKAISISGTTINVGSATLVEAGTFGQCAVSKATSTAGRYLAAYNHRAVVLDVSGTSVTVRTPANFDANTASRATGAGQSGENVIIGYYKSATFYAQVISSITTSFSTNTIYQISTTNYADGGQTSNIRAGPVLARFRFHPPIGPV